MSRWRDLWREYVKSTSYQRILQERGITNDQFWSEYAPVYEEVLERSGYPGEILERVSSLIPSGSSLLDVGAGTGAFAIPLAPRTRRVLALDPSTHQLKVLEEKARSKGINNIEIINSRWGEVDPCQLVDLDFSLAAYSIFEEDVYSFLKKMIDVSSKGVLLVFRAGRMDPLQEFVYGPRPQVDYSCLIQILEEMGYDFQVEIFSRDYVLPLHCILHGFFSSTRSTEEIIRYLEDEGRIVAPQIGSSMDGIGEGEEPWVRVKSDDALLYRLG